LSTTATSTPNEPSDTWTGKSSKDKESSSRKQKEESKKGAKEAADRLATAPTQEGEEEGETTPEIVEEATPTEASSGKEVLKTMISATIAEKLVTGQTSAESLAKAMVSTSKKRAGAMPAVKRATFKEIARRKKDIAIGQEKSLDRRHPRVDLARDRRMEAAKSAGRNQGRAEVLEAHPPPIPKIKRRKGKPHDLLPKRVRKGKMRQEINNSYYFELN